MSIDTTNRLEAAERRVLPVSNSGSERHATNGRQTIRLAANANRDLIEVISINASILHYEIGSSGVD